MSTNAIPPPSNEAESRSINLAIAQAFEGFGRSMRLAMNGDQEAAFEAARFQKIIGDIQRILAQQTAASEASRSTSIEPQSGVAKAAPTLPQGTPGGVGAVR